MAAPGASYGSATVHRVVDIDPFALPLSFLFPGATLEALGPTRDVLAGSHIDLQTASVLLAIQSHLIRFGGKTILIDTCVGEHKPRPARADWHQRVSTRYLANLAAAGCTPDDVDIVMCTHLHADHVGWNTRLEFGPLGTHLSQGALPDQPYRAQAPRERGDGTPRGRSRQLSGQRSAYYRPWLGYYGPGRR